jgi:hypothetical protein
MDHRPRSRIGAFYFHCFAPTNPPKAQASRRTRHLSRSPIKKVSCTRKPVGTRWNPRYGAFMQTLFPQSEERTPRNGGIQIEAAYDCDGSRCHQPVFRQDGTLNYVAPHCHLVEWSPRGPCYFPIFCDFPEDSQQSSHVLRNDSLFANYPPF